MVQATMDAAVRLSGTENAMKAKEAITRATLPIEDEAILAEMKRQQTEKKSFFQRILFVE
jgi:hypothetical protein